MDISLKKELSDLEREVALKSMELEEKIKDFKVKIEKCRVASKFINITPACVRCNLCVEECPVNAIKEPDNIRQANILENCVKCEICAQTCPIGCVNVVELIAEVDEQLTYKLNYLKIPHRLLKMKDIRVSGDKCTSCGTCTKFCPTGAITSNEDEPAKVNKMLCIGCGACAHLCPPDAIKLKRELGPIIETKKLIIDQETCVECLVCEENCPMRAISLEDGKVIVDKDKCILCEVCSKKCPVAALKLERLTDES